ncbi:MAG: hypothetical protein COB50_02015 [Thiotrichales bacterium]|nr:MAG: hypothetical protein COB50_02015 [Thiotrichales bacterium]
MNMQPSKDDMKKLLVYLRAIADHNKITQKDIPSLNLFSEAIDLDRKSDPKALAEKYDAIQDFSPKDIINVSRNMQNENIEKMLVKFNESTDKENIVKCIERAKTTIVNTMQETLAKLPEGTKKQLQYQAANRVVHNNAKPQVQQKPSKLAIFLRKIKNKIQSVIKKLTNPIEDTILAIQIKLYDIVDSFKEKRASSENPTATVQDVPNNNLQIASFANVAQLYQSNNNTYAANNSSIKQIINSKNNAKIEPLPTKLSSNNNKIKAKVEQTRKHSMP